MLSRMWRAWAVLPQTFVSSANQMTFPAVLKAEADDTKQPRESARRFIYTGDIFTLLGGGGGGGGGGGE